MLTIVIYVLFKYDHLSLACLNLFHIVAVLLLTVVINKHLLSSFSFAFLVQNRCQFVFSDLEQMLTTRQNWMQNYC